MENDENQTAAERREKRGAAVDRARQHRGEDDEKRGVEGRFARERTLMAYANDEQGDDENENAPDRDLQEREFLRFDAETEQSAERVEEVLHAEMMRPAHANGRGELPMNPERSADSFSSQSVRRFA